MKKLLFSLVMCIGFSGMLLAQSDNQTITLQIPQVAMLKLMSVAPLNFQFQLSAPNVAGEPIEAPGVPADLTYLVYSSVNNTAGSTGYRTVSVKTDVQPLDGYSFTVFAGAAASSGAGKKGNPGGIITLSTTSRNMITGIGSSYTGSALQNGHALNYGVSVANGSAAYATLVSGSKQYVVTYTLSEN